MNCAVSSLLWCTTPTTHDCVHFGLSSNHPFTWETLRVPIYCHYVWVRGDCGILCKLYWTMGSPEQCKYFRKIIFVRFIFVHAQSFPVEEHVQRASDSPFSSSSWPDSWSHAASCQPFSLCENKPTFRTHLLFSPTLLWRPTATTVFSVLSGYDYSYCWNRKDSSDLHLLVRKLKLK